MGIMNTSDSLADFIKIILKSPTLNEDHIAWIQHYYQTNPTFGAYVDMYYGVNKLNDQVEAMDEPEGNVKDKKKNKKDKQVIPHDVMPIQEVLLMTVLDLMRHNENMVKILYSKSNKKKGRDKK